MSAALSSSHILCSSRCTPQTASPSGVYLHHHGFIHDSSPFGKVPALIWVSTGHSPFRGEECMLYHKAPPPLTFVISLLFFTLFILIFSLSITLSPPFPWLPSRCCYLGCKAQPCPVVGPLEQAGACMGQPPDPCLCQGIHTQYSGNKRLNVFSDQI